MNILRIFGERMETGILFLNAHRAHCSFMTAVSRRYFIKLSIYIHLTYIFLAFFYPNVYLKYIQSFSIITLSHFRQRSLWLFHHCKITSAFTGYSLSMFLPREIYSQHSEKIPSFEITPIREWLFEENGCYLGIKSLCLESLTARMSTLCILLITAHVPF